MEIAMRESRNCWNGTGVGTLACVVASFVVFSTFTGLFAEGERDRAGSDHLAAEYPATIVPLMKRYCLRCHSTEKQKGELDLERFTGVSQLREDLEPWRKVIEMLDNGEMPPEKSRQPSAEERQQIVEWVQAFLDAEARANAGDPGRVAVLAVPVLCREEASPCGVVAREGGGGADAGVDGWLLERRSGGA